MAKKNFDSFGLPERKPRRPKFATPQAVHPDFEKQISRTVFVNNLAADLNSIIKEYFDRYKISDFYQRAQSKMRKEPLNNPFLLIRRLREMDLHPRYPLGALGSHKLTTAVKKKKELEVSVGVNAFETKALRNHNKSYSLKLILICWLYNINKPVHFCQDSEWLHYAEKDMIFDFNFTLPKNTRFFMICLWHMQGNDEIRDLNMRANAMRIIQVDSLDEEDSALAKERDDAAKYNEPKKPKPDTSIIRVKARKADPKSDA